MNQQNYPNNIQFQQFQVNGNNYQQGDNSFPNFQIMQAVNLGNQLNAQFQNIFGIYQNIPIQQHHRRFDFNYLSDADSDSESE